MTIVNEDCLTVYSDKVQGDAGNFNWAVRFDVTDGYVGISQWGDSGCERILLSPAQIKVLFEFIKDQQ